MPKSSSEVEYRAMASTIRDVVWLTQLLTDLGFPLLLSIPLFCGNHSALHIASNPMFHEHTKHIDIDCHIVRTKLMEGLINTTHISTHEQPTDSIIEVVIVCCKQRNLDEEEDDDGGVSSRNKKLWKEGELRSLVFLSLTAQILLIVLGNRRKYIHGKWINAIVWSAYLLADAVATMGLGLILNEIGDIYGNGGFTDAKSELTAFWAPFFLLHLGGPDTITAYSLEDNELYLRHVFQLFVQTLVTIVIFLTAFNGLELSILAIPLIIVGFIKYGEKTWNLWSVSSNQLRESVLSSTTAADSNYSKSFDEYRVYLAEGYKVERDFIIDDHIRIDVPQSGENVTSVQKIILAHVLFHKLKCLFADLSTSDVDRQIVEALLKRMSHQGDVFDTIAIELGFIYDLLYTKAFVIHTRWGLIRRVITTSLTTLVLVVFCFVNKKKYIKLDVYITFLLLGVAIVLELSAAVFLLFSDQSRNWFIGPKKMNAILKFINTLEEKVTQQRWSKSMGQCSITSLCIKEKSGRKIPGLNVVKRLLKKLRYLDKLLKKHRYITSFTRVTDELQGLIFKHVSLEHDQFKENILVSEKKLKELEERMFNDVKKEHEYLFNGIDGSEANLKEFFELTLNHVKKNVDQFKEDRGKHYTKTRGSRALEKHNLLKLSAEVEFDESILIWHIATELCYYQDKHSRMLTDDSKMSMVMSKYLMYLLVKSPFLLSISVGGVVRCRDTLSKLEKCVKQPSSSTGNRGDHNENDISNPAWKYIRELSTQEKEGKGKSVFYYADKLASELKEIEDKKWEIVRDVWVEMLTYAASQGGQ
ncbi:uncharacterized protein LOC116124719 [Pistacia vera]|uniref:uncharacterized protein LOC116124719 n=1 Tax=Pistacia vera TaxID=55513 RepID=UPI0012632643|nr:uncharacterized protein LOC116124719 [Pistacia vera]